MAVRLATRASASFQLIVFSEIQESPRYPAGFAVRFGRVKRHRPDKSGAEADTIQTVMGLFQKQAGEESGQYDPFRRVFPELL